jgi:hypothetical protein
VAEVRASEDEIDPRRRIRVGSDSYLGSVTATQIGKESSSGKVNSFSASEVKHCNELLLFLFSEFSHYR